MEVLDSESGPVRGSGRGSDGGQFFAQDRQQVPAVVHDVVEVVVAADGDQVGAEGDIIEDRGGHRLRGADQCGRGALGVGGGGGGGPQRAVVQFTGLRGGQKPLGADVLGQVGRGGALVGALQGGEDRVRLLPGLVLGGSD